MNNPHSILLVEGRSDQELFSYICSSVGLKAKVQVAPPRDVGGRANNKEGVITHFEILLPQLADENTDLNRLALIVDADHIENHGLGYIRTFIRIEEIVQNFGYTFDKSISRNLGGSIFKNNEGLNDIGLWIMPNNRDEGGVEQWVRSCIRNEEMEFFRKAESAVRSIAPQRFKETQREKANLATWLALQQQPGRGPAYAFREHLVDNKKTELIKIINWLKHLYA